MGLYASTVKETPLVDECHGIIFQIIVQDTHKHMYAPGRMTHV